MKEQEKHKSATKDKATTHTSEAWQQPESTALQLSQLRTDLRTGLLPAGHTPEQLAALTAAHAALQTYMTFYYPTDPQWGKWPTG